MPAGVRADVDRIAFILLALGLTFADGGCRGFPPDSLLVQSFARDESSFLEFLSMMRTDPSIHYISATLIRAPGGIFEVQEAGPIKAGSLRLSRERWNRYKSLLQKLQLDSVGVGSDGTIYFVNYQTDEEAMGLTYSETKRESCDKELRYCGASEVHSFGPRTYSRAYRQLKPNWYIYQVRYAYDRSKE
jgi:hypothetical protein